MKSLFKIQNIHKILCLFSALCGAISLFYNRYDMVSDGSSYCDIGDAFMRGDWGIAINGFWNALYPLMAGFFLTIFNPSYCFEIPTLQFLNFFIYLFSIGGFIYFLDGLILHMDAQDKNTTTKNIKTLPRALFIFFSYIFFLWAELRVLKIQFVTPDLLIAGFYLFILGILLRTSLKKTQTFHFVCLGFLLGFSFLAKSVMFPVSLIVIGLMFLETIKSKIKFSHFLITVLIYTFLITPFIIMLSKQKGRFTFGETGRWHSVIHIQRINTLYFWQGEGDNIGTAERPVKRIFENPNVYEFNRKGRITHGLLYDPSYWAKGLKPRLEFDKVFNNLKFTSNQFLNFFWKSQRVFILCFFLCLCLSWNSREWLRYVQKLWLPIIPCVVGLCLYLMMYMLTRYITLFILPLWLILFSGITYRQNFFLKLTIFFLIILSVLPYCSSVLKHTLVQAKSIASQIIKKEDFWRDTHCEIAKILEAKGFQEQDPIAFVGLSSTAYWVRLLRLKVIAEVPQTDAPNFWGKYLESPKDGRQALKFWQSSPDKQEEVLAALKQTGAKAIFTLKEPNNDWNHKNWDQIGNSNYFILQN